MITSMYLICIPGVRAAAHRSWRARRECQLEICHRRGADQHQGAVQQHQGARAADWAEEQRACEEQSQQLKLSKLQNRDPPGGGGLPLHQLFPHLLHWGARWDGDLGVLKLKDSRGCWFLAVNFWIFGGKPKVWCVNSPQMLPLTFCCWWWMLMLKAYSIQKWIFWTIFHNVKGMRF